MNCCNRIRKSLEFHLRKLLGRFYEKVSYLDSLDGFNALHKRMATHTLMSKNRLFMIYQFVQHARNLKADMAEVGVFRGGTAKLIALSNPQATAHLFDTFSGMPAQCSPLDMHKPGDFKDVSLDSVKEFLSDCPNVSFYPGVFPKTADSIKDKAFSFVHIDVDIYASVRDCLAFFYPRMVKAGVMLIDDYDFYACEGVKKAVQEFLVDKNEVPIITTEGQCAIIKQ
ncbi:MAG: macrocin-O-methyltransferase [Candidatus Omnitrophica bacterium]|nr:macrocin-O-methyltransferase [Candidatus Omnitrophota bacterium]